MKRAGEECVSPKTKSRRASDTDKILIITGDGVSFEEKATTFSGLSEKLDMITSMGMWKLEYRLAVVDQFVIWLRAGLKGATANSSNTSGVNMVSADLLRLFVECDLSEFFNAAALIYLHTSDHVDPIVFDMVEKQKNETLAARLIARCPKIDYSKWPRLAAAHAQYNTY